MTREEYLKMYFTQLQAYKNSALHLSEDDLNFIAKTNDFLTGKGDKKSGDDGEGSFASMITRLMDLLEKTNDEEEISKIMALIDTLYKQESNAENTDDNTSVGSFIPSQLANSEKIDDNPIVQKAKDYGAWARQKFEESINPTKKKKKPALISTGKFGNLSREDLLKYFDPNVFYGLSEKQREALFQATINEYLKSNGYQPCALRMHPMGISKKSIHYGLYRPQFQEIYLNSNLFNNIDALGDRNNPYFPYQVLSTLIHEATHHMQFQDAEAGKTDARNRAIQMSMSTDQSKLSHSQYLAEADELDARNSALAYMRDAAKIATGEQQETLVGFYDSQRQREQNNGKMSVSASVMALFPEIYGGRYIGDPSLRGSMMSYSDEMRSILNGSFPVPTL